MYAAEVDGILVKAGSDANPKKHPELLQKSDLVELKTTRQFPNGQMTHNFRRYVFFTNFERLGWSNLS